MLIDRNKNILIIGLGLIGGSYALGFKEKGFKVGAITKDQESIDYAISNNIIDEGTTKVEREFILNYDLIVFALYPKVLIEWMEKYHSYIKKGTLVTDVTGIKSEIVYKIQDILKDDGVEYIGSHPMAGKEVYGVRNSDHNIFKGANFIITPTEKNTLEAIQECKEIGTLLGFKNISVISPHLHDEMVAFLSQLTHCIAVSLMTCKESRHLKEYTGDSFRDLTRIANINEDMWSELFLMNKKELVSQMDLFLKEFTKLKDSIDNEDIDTMKEMMRLSTYRRSFFNK